MRSFLCKLVLKQVSYLSFSRFKSNIQSIPIIQEEIVRFEVPISQVIRPVYEGYSYFVDVDSRAHSAEHKQEHWQTTTEYPDACIYRGFVNNETFTMVPAAMYSGVFVQSGRREYTETFRGSEFKIVMYDEFPVPLEDNSEHEHLYFKDGPFYRVEMWSGNDRITDEDMLTAFQELTKHHDDETVSSR